MPNIGLPEIIIVLVLALIVFGPKKLPEMGRSLGRSLREFKNATSGIKDDLQAGLNDEPAKPDEAAAPLATAAVAATVEAPVTPVVAAVAQPATPAPATPAADASPAAGEAAGDDSPPPPEYDPQAAAEAVATYGSEAQGDPVATAGAAEPVEAAPEAPTDASQGSAAD